MRIYDADNNKSIKNIMLIITVAEAAELRSDLDNMLAHNYIGNHSHINDKEYEHEITLSIYDEKNFNEFNERIIKLITYDE